MKDNKVKPISLDSRKNFKENPVRWLILVFACNYVCLSLGVVMMGDAFSFDNPQSLET